MSGRCVGEHNGKAKLTEEMVLEIRRCRLPYALIAEKFRVSNLDRLRHPQKTELVARLAVREAQS